MDYGAAAPKYIEAFFANIQWERVEERLDRAENLARVRTSPGA
jgi:superoxide dismutase, Fe-Mn family